MPAKKSRAGVLIFLAVCVFNYLTDASQLESDVKYALPSPLESNVEFQAEEKREELNYADFSTGLSALESNVEFQSEEKREELDYADFSTDIINYFTTMKHAKLAYCLFGVLALIVSTYVYEHLKSTPASVADDSHAANLSSKNDQNGPSHDTHHSVEGKNIQPKHQQDIQPKHQQDIQPKHQQ
eukprot:608716_1